MKKIAIIKSLLGNYGGLEKAFSLIVRELIKKEIIPTIITRSSPKQNFFSDVSLKKVHTLSWPKFYRLLSFDTYACQWLRKNPHDVVLAMDRTTNQTHMRAGNGVHAAYLQKTAFIDKDKIYSPYHRTILHLEKKGFENPALQKIYTNSHMVKQEVLSYYQVDEQKIEVIHNGVEWDRYGKFFQKWEEEKAKQSFLPNDRFHFLFVGNGFARKGLSILLKGLSILERKEFDLTVVGTDKHIDLFKKLSFQLGLEKNVFFAGKCENIIPFYQMADCLVIPSFYDPFANVTLEALAMGLTVISSKNNGGHEILTKNNGWVIQNLYCEEEMAFYLKKALQTPKTAVRAARIRDSIAYLDESIQINKLIHSMICE